MGKAKKGKRNVNDGDVDSETENIDSAIINENQTKEKLKSDKINNEDKKSKKNKNKNNEDDDIDEITKNIEDIDISKKKKGKTATKKQDSDDEADDIKTSKTKSKTKKSKKQLSDDEDDVDTAPVKSNKSKAKGGFDVLEVEDGVDAKSDSDNEDSKKSNKKNEPESKKEAGGKKGKKKKKRDDSDDEDIEKVLAELALEYSGGKKDVEPTPEREEVEDVSEKKKEKKKKATESVEESKQQVEDDDEISGTVKTAAQKKKEKKEREKAKKMTDKQKTLGGKKQESIESEPKALEENPENDEPAEEQTTKDKKKKKGAKEEEKKGKTGKGPDKKTIAAMQEALKKMKEEEERLKREEEERIKREEEAEEARLEQERLEQERKEKRKQKEKERKDRRKAEGKLLTPKQKLERARAQALLEERRKQLLLLQGGEGIPEEIVEPKKPRLGTRIRPNKLKKESSQEKSEEQAKPEEDSANKEPERQSSQEAEVKKEDDVKDSWDAESSEEEEPESKEEKDETKVSNKAETKKAEKSENEESSSGSDEDSESGSDSEEESADEQEKQSDAERKRARALARIQKRREEAEKSKTLEDLRAAVVCVLGHVDTGKTKILDKLRRTNVQDGEAGGITQQIGATNVPIENIREQTKIVKGFADKEFKLPGLLIIDTPGHESFSNLRNRGSSLCDIAILVVDIMHGLEPQTIESINLLKQKRVPFVVALNKIDRLYDWETMSRRDVRDILKSQASHTQVEFDNRMKEVVLQFAEQGLNAALFYENPDPKTYISLIPTSAITGEGMGNLLALIVDMCQTHLAKRLMYSSELQATVLEVKAIPGLGTTIDVILINGILKEGDTMILAGTDGPVVTQIRSLLMPQPMRELRVKNAYIEHREVRAAQGVKIAAKELEKAIAGLNLVVAHHPDEVDVLREEVAREFKSALSSIKLQERGVFVQASTLGSLEALLDFLKSSKIPYAGIRIGPVVKKDVMKASIMLEHDSQYATILAFDVKIERDAQELADSLGVKIFQADIIYHLFDKFTAYREELKQRKRDEFKNVAVFPCKLRVLPQFVFNSRDPIVCGVMVEAGIVKEGTPICVPSQEFVDLGIVTSIESNHKPVESARKGQEICIKIEPIPGEAPKMFGRHFDETDMLVSKISRQSIDACKDYFRDDLIKTDWQLMVELKKLFQIL